MIVLFVLAAIVAGLAAWIVRLAGWRFAAQRLGGALLILVIVTFATSMLLRLSSDDQQTKDALVELGLPESAGPCVSQLGTGATVEKVSECVDDRGLDQDPFTQYAGWATDVLGGDLGPAFYKNGDAEPLSGTIKHKMPRTAWLFLYSQIIALVIAVPLGIWSAYQASRGGRSVPRWALPTLVAVAVAIALALGWGLAAMLCLAIAMPVLIFNLFRGGRAGDSTINTLAFVLLSIPVFVIGESLRYVFAIQHDWYQLSGYNTWGDGFRSHLGSVWLPAFVLGLSATPVYLRLLRADMIQNLQQDFVAVAKAKGMSNSHILLRHVLRPSTLTLLTVAGLNIAQLVNGAIVVEFIFDYDGMGSFLLDAVANRNFFAVQTIVALVAVLFILSNTIVDMLYTIVDPRVRAGATQ